jgi:PIN domain nuclease of toxin-antitoxin system
MIAIDTHVWIYLVTGQHEKTNELILNAISCWEVALLEKKGRLELDRPADVWIKNALLYPSLKVIDLTPDILVKAIHLKEFHTDPADRMIVAACILNSWSLITKDKRIHAYKNIKTIW